MSPSFVTPFTLVSLCLVLTFTISVKSRCNIYLFKRHYIKQEKSSVLCTVHTVEDEVHGCYVSATLKKGATAVCKVI